MASVSVEFPPNVPTNIPHYLEGVLTVGDTSYSIRPIQAKDRRGMITFLTANSAPYFRDGKPYTVDAAALRVNALIDRHLQGIPWSCYLIRDPDQTIAGYWTLGFDDRVGSLQIGVFIQEKYRNLSLATSAWKWTSETLIPEMDRCGVLVNGLPLRFGTIYAMTHPENAPSNRLFTKVGFRKFGKTEVDAYHGSNTGDRNLYGISINELLMQKKGDSDRKESQ